ncbi:HNH endonuclease [Shimia thalassica]|uniref:HNH endonuclease n=1 Tax=Shimia thalassica TaxID=1715693 RepID=UPI0026E39F1D|nr:HNH endonuclease [Shimia thalassica]MDO6477987.1 HNH endonuclease [Shimia thalassica]MDO6522150.1 HNH endonuclease [Shimia thalassica]MDP2518954.1 HNH endonuclease [Shimia thalassica]
MKSTTNEETQMTNLANFLNTKMSMSEVYQPAIIKALLQNGGKCTKQELAADISKYDLAARDYYAKIVMRYPKDTLTKHGVVAYDRSSQTFVLLGYPQDEEMRDQLLQTCQEKIEHWQTARRQADRATLGGSKRYEVLRRAKGKCELCGISSEVSPIDVDHIVPRSKANKGKVRTQGKWVDLHDLSNLQALCSACNRGKRDSDQTDFRRRSKLVRDRIPEIISSAGRSAKLEKVSGAKLKAALLDKLMEEHAEFLAAKTKTARLEELTDLFEVITALAVIEGHSTAELLDLAQAKREQRGGFEEGWVLAI